MSLFGFLWLPLFYLFWRAVTGNYSVAGGIWAFIGGSVVALIQFMYPLSLIQPIGFGFSRWFDIYLDIVVLPALIPLLIYLLLVGFRVIIDNYDFTGFAFLWLIPGAALRVIGWDSQNDSFFVMLIPLFWTAIVVGLPFFIPIIQDGGVLIIFLSTLAIFAVPIAAASSYWALYSQKTLIGVLLLALAFIPLMVSLFMSLLREGSRE